MINEEIKENTGACEENAPKKEKKHGKKETALLDKIAELEATIKEKDDQHLRMAAEYDNFRRRSREEKDATYDKAMADAVKELLPIIDNIERAAQFDGEGTLKDGIVMVLKSCTAALSKLGVEAYGERGDIFDPNLHNAVMHEENDELGEGVIVEVFQKGYKKGNKIIRFAMVKTAN